MINPKWIVCDGAVRISMFFPAGLKIPRIISNEAGPESRITAIAPVPGGVDNAQIVSVMDMWYM